MKRKLELDRRKLDRRVQLLKERLEKLKRQRQVQRRARNRSDVLSVSIVGYTNAGKSTLFNRLTQCQRVCGRPVVRHAGYHFAPHVH